MEYETGDIVVVRGSGWLANSICELTHSNASHVGLVISTNPVQVIQALTTVKQGSIEDMLRGVQKYWVYKYLGLTEAQAYEVVKAALKFSGEEYGYLDILLQLLNCIFKTRWFTQSICEKWLDHYPICSFLVAEAFSAIGVDFGVKDVSTTPGDIKSHCLAHPELFAEVI